MFIKSQVSEVLHIFTSCSQQAHKTDSQVSEKNISSSILYWQNTDLCFLSTVACFLLIFEDSCSYTTRSEIILPIKHLQLTSKRLLCSIIYFEMNFDICLHPTYLEFLVLLNKGCLVAAGKNNRLRSSQSTCNLALECGLYGRGYLSWSPISASCGLDGQKAKPCIYLFIAINFASLLPVESLQIFKGRKKGVS